MPAIRMLFVFVTLTLAIHASPSRSGPDDAAHRPARMEDLSRFLGTWDLVNTSYRPDGSAVQSRAISHAYLVLDGHALQDDFRTLDDNGNVIFRGTSFRTLDPDGEGFLIRWLMVGDSGMTEIHARFEGDELHATGEGRDGYGPFMERFVYRFEGPDRYVFEMARSYDGGTNWFDPFNRIEATRRAD